MAVRTLAEAPVSAAPQPQASPFAVQFKSFATTSPSSLILLVGRQGHGKTTTALTLSEKFDVNGPPGQVLDDIMVISNEKGALDCARHCVSQIPYWCDLTDYADAGLAVFEKVEAAVLKEAKNLAAAGKIKGVIYDNASTRDKILAAYKAKEKEGWPLINWLMMRHREFVMEGLLPIPCPVALTAHTQPIKTMTPVERETMGVEVDDREIINMIGNQAASFYRFQSSLVVPVFKTTKGGKDEYALYPRGTNGIESKVRFKNADVDKLPPNLRQLLAMTVSK